MLEIQNLTFAYGESLPALVDVSVEFPRGTISAVLGESGSGKTTLLMCLGRFLQVQSGAIRLDGKDVQAMSEHEFRRAVGIVFQKLYLFPHLSVLDNMTLALKHVAGASEREAEAQARDTLERLGILEIAQSYPSQISGGQAQRAAIARGLLLKPEYMLLDEPTSALDANTTDAFAEWLLDLQEATNFVIVTHDTLFASKVASTGVYLSGGQVLDRGPVETIIEHVRAGEVVNGA